MENWDEVVEYIANIISENDVYKNEIEKIIDENIRLKEENERLKEELTLEEDDLK